LEEISRNTNLRDLHSSARTCCHKKRLTRKKGSQFLSFRVLDGYRRGSPLEIYPQNSTIQHSNQFNCPRGASARVKASDFSKIAIVYKDASPWIHAAGRRSRIILGRVRADSRVLEIPEIRYSKRFEYFRVRTPSFVQRARTCGCARKA